MNWPRLRPELKGKKIELNISTTREITATAVIATPPFPEPPVYADKNPAVMSRAKLAVKLIHQQMTRLSLGAISNSAERLAGRGFLTFSFLTFFGFAAATFAAFAGFATFAAFAGFFLVASVSLDSTLSSSPIFSPHSCVHFRNLLVNCKVSRFDKRSNRRVRHVSELLIDDVEKFTTLFVTYGCRICSNFLEQFKTIGR